VPILVLGAGLSGLSTARYLAPYPTVVVEKEKDPGGTARTVESGGFTFDYTGHLLHLHHDETRRLARSLLRNNLVECERRAWIHSAGVRTRYPFQANLHGLPWPVIEKCYAGLWTARRRFGPDALEGGTSLPFLDWCERTFGRGITEHFMAPYNRKLWGTPLETLTADWTGPFVPRPRLEDALAGALEDNQTAYGYNASFFYPKRGGIQSLSRALAAGLPDLRLGVSVEKVFWQDRRVKLSSGDVLSYSYMVSCLPLPELIRRLDPFPAELREPLSRLRWTSVLCLNLGVRRPGISDASWIYFPEEDFIFYRVGFPSNFSPHAAPSGCSSMYVEVSHKPGEGYESPARRSALLKKVRAGLEKAGILRRSDELPVVQFLPIPYAYVLYDGARASSVDTLLEWLREKAHGSSIGRYGAWKYSFMEEAILDGKKTAGDLLRHL
jgi:protoporphyrinogen oxidase